MLWSLLLSQAARISLHTSSGVALAAFGKLGLDLLSEIIVGDLATIRWRGFWSGMLISPFLVIIFIDGFISDALIPDQWRYGLSMFAIMVPVLVLPAIGTLYGLQRKVVKAGIADTRGATEHSEDNTARSKDMSKYGQIIWSGNLEIDLAGLVLLGFAFSESYSPSHSLNPRSTAGPTAA